MISFEQPLHRGKLIRRYKRFFADIELPSGEIITAHCPNTGSMKSCGTEGQDVICSYTDDPKRKLSYTWEFTKTKGGYICVNTHTPQKLVKQALIQKLIPEFKQYDLVKPEVKYGKENRSRIDFLLSDSEEVLPNCYIEIKNVTLWDQGKLMFPDAVSERAKKHLHELMHIKSQGHRAVLLFIISRPEGDHMEPATQVDPEYTALIDQAQSCGVEVLAYRSRFDFRSKKLCLVDSLPFKIPLN